MKKTTSISIINWTACIIGTLMIAISLFIGIGEMLEGQNKPGPGLDTYTIITFAVWAIGLAGPGGLISFLIQILPTPQCYCHSCYPPYYFY
jgi:hypothetical protein